MGLIIIRLYIMAFFPMKVASISLDSTAGRQDPRGPDLTVPAVRACRPRGMPWLLMCHGDVGQVAWYTWDIQYSAYV